MVGVDPVDSGEGGFIMPSRKVGLIQFKEARGTLQVVPAIKLVLISDGGLTDGREVETVLLGVDKVHVTSDE